MAERKKVGFWKVTMIVILTLLVAVGIFMLVAAICAHVHNIGFIEQLKIWTEAVLEFLKSKISSPKDPEVSINPIMMLK